MKLGKLKRWLRLSEVAQYLSIVSREQITELDLLQFAINCELPLSVFLFEPTHACQVEFPDTESSFEDEVALDVININVDNIIKIDGLYDLLPTRAAINTFKSAYRESIGGKPLQLQSFQGLFLSDERGLIYQLYEERASDQQQCESLEYLSTPMFSRSYSRNSNREEQPTYLFEPSPEYKANDNNEFKEFRPLRTFPEGVLLCVSTNNLQDFQASISDYNCVKATANLGDLERSSLLKIILCVAIQKYGYRPGKSRNSATGANKGSIAADLETLGLNLDPDTIRKFVQEADERFGDLLPPFED